MGEEREGGRGRGGGREGRRRRRGEERRERDGGGEGYPGVYSLYLLIWVHTLHTYYIHTNTIYTHTNTHIQ